MKSTNILPMLTILVGATSCQVGPFYYTLDRDTGVYEEFYVPCDIDNVGSDVDNVRSADHADELACVTVSPTGDTYTVDESGCVEQA